MENNSAKIFTNKTISVATYFGGPIAAGFLIARNFKIFGKPDAARNSVFIGIISTIIMFGLLFMIPEKIIDKIPAPLIPAIYTAIISLIIERKQGAQIKAFLANNGQTASNWQAAGYGLLGLLVIAGFIAIVVLATPPGGYKNKIDISPAVTLYYNNEVEETTARQVSDEIKHSGFLADSEGSDLFLNNEENFYRLKFVIIDTSLLRDERIIQDYNFFEQLLNENLKLDKPVEIGFTDVNLLNDFELVEN